MAECERLVCVKALKIGRKKRETCCLAEEQPSTVVNSAGGPMMRKVMQDTFDTLVKDLCFCTPSKNRLSFLKQAERVHIYIFNSPKIA